MKKIMTFTVVYLCFSSLVYAGSLDTMLGRWAGYYEKANESNKSYDSWMYVYKSDQNEYISLWSIGEDSDKNHGFSQFGIENDIFYSCEWDHTPYRCTYWQFLSATVIRGFRYEADKKGSTLVGTFYFYKN